MRLFRFPISVLVVALLATAIIFWSLLKRYQCNCLLNEEGQTVMLFAESSEKAYSIEGGPEVISVFSTLIDSVRIKATTTAFRRIVPIGMPIYARYTDACDDCLRVIYDSVVIYNNKRFEFVPLENKLYDYRISQTGIND